MTTVQGFGAVTEGRGQGSDFRSVLPLEMTGPVTSQNQRPGPHQQGCSKDWKTSGPEARGTVQAPENTVLNNPRPFAPPELSTVRPSQNNRKDFKLYLQ